MRTVAMAIVKMKSVFETECIYPSNAFSKECEDDMIPVDDRIDQCHTSPAVLILDDDVEFREDLAEYLANSGLAVRHIGDPRMLTPKMLDGSTLLLDLTMPGVDGIDILRNISNYSTSPKVILVSGCSEDIIEAAAQGARLAKVRIQGTLKKPFDPQTLVDMLKVADAAEAPSHSAPLHPPAPAELAAALEDALADGSVPVAFQPKGDVHTLAFCGAEILLGDQWPKLGRTSVAALVAEAGRVPQLLTRLTFHMVRAAAMGCATWRAAGFSGAVSVNVPLETLQHPENISKFAEVVREAGITPADMILELTEDALYDSTSTSLMALVQARLYGFGIALDDVAQEQSGLLQLANLPITELKIDRELLVKARCSQKAQDIYKFLVDLGHRLGLKVVSEGVETEADLSFVREERVDILQGYFFSRKVPISQLMKMLESNSGKFPISQSQAQGSRSEHAR